MEDITIIHRNLSRFKSLADKILVNWDDYEFFLDFIGANFRFYLKILPLFEGYVKSKLIDNKDTTICLCNKIPQAISNYLKGRVVSAYKDMTDAFSCVKDILAKKSADRHAFNGEFGFRGAIIKPDEPAPTRKRMFHMPFEMRHLVQDYRYSIHGLPSIYLGRSIYDCYVELGSPSLDNFWVSLFNFSQNPENVFGSKQHINLIDLSLSYKKHEMDITLNHFKNKEESLTYALDQLANDILLWPLIMVCSIPCKYPEAKFKQEYIIPQTLYQLCSDYNEYVGIRYLSTKTRCISDNIYPHAMENFALPAHDVRKAGYCPKLASQLVLTMPITFNKSQDIEIYTEDSYSSFGFPILSNMHESLQRDKTILYLDKMTIYFDRLIHSFMEEKKADLLTPLYGWKENED